MSDLVQVAVIVSIAPTMVGVMTFITSFMIRNQSRKEHRDTKEAVIELTKEVNHRLDAALKAQYDKGRADLIAEQSSIKITHQEGIIEGQIKRKEET